MSEIFITPVAADRAKLLNAIPKITDGWHEP